MARNKTVEELILIGFEKSRYEANFPVFSDEEYIGYIVGVTKLSNWANPAGIREYLQEARRLFKEGKL